MTHYPEGLDPIRFCQQHWQKRWLYLPSAMPHVPDLLTPERLAGMACEDEVESRLILRRNASWEIRHGPFDEHEFADLPAENWTLLVQNVETHLPELRSVLSAFSFLPAWRVDDLMVSYAAPGGTVGPHIDEYDVFLLQGTGRRVWQIDPAPDDRSCRPGLDLQILSDFRPAETVSTDPGDLLYLPPGVAHYGVGDTASMTWSIGFRAPSAADLLFAAAELAEVCDAPGRYCDADLATDEVDGGRIDVAAAARARRVLDAAMPTNDAQLLELLGRAATRLKPWLRPDPPAVATDASVVADRLCRGCALERHPASRLAWSDTPEGVLLFVDGTVARLTRAQAPFAAYLSDAPLLAAETIAAHARRPEVAEVIASLLTQGSLYWCDHGPDDRTPGDAAQ